MRKTEGRKRNKKDGGRDDVIGGSGEMSSVT